MVAFATGYWHTRAMITGFGITCWSDSYDEDLRDGATTQRDMLVDVVRLGSGVNVIVAGQWHTRVLTAGGGIKYWRLQLW